MELASVIDLVLQELIIVLIDAIEYQCPFYMVI